MIAAAAQPSRSIVEASAFSSVRPPRMTMGIASAAPTKAPRFQPYFLTKYNPSTAPKVSTPPRNPVNTTHSATQVSEKSSSASRVTVGLISKNANANGVETAVASARSFGSMSTPMNRTRPPPMEFVPKRPTFSHSYLIPGLPPDSTQSR